MSDSDVYFLGERSERAVESGFVYVGDRGDDLQAGYGRQPPLERILHETV